MNKKIIPTAMLDEHSENIGIDKMTVRYTQQPDCNDPDRQPQFLTVETVGYDDGDEESVKKGEQGYYLVLSTERWAIDSPKEMEMVLNDFFARLGVNKGLPLLKIADELVQVRIGNKEPVIQQLIVDENQDTDTDPAKKGPTAPKPVDVLMDDGWVTFSSTAKAAKAIGVTTAWLSKSLQLDKTCNGFYVRYSNPELDATFAEIKERDKQPYEVSKKP